MKLDRLLVFAIIGCVLGTMLVVFSTFAIMRIVASGRDAELKAIKPPAQTSTSTDKIEYQPEPAALLTYSSLVKWQDPALAPDSAMVFIAPNGAEIMRIEHDGTVMAHGRVVATDLEIYRLLKRWSYSVCGR